MIVAICGKFDPIHDGHIDHIVKASKLGSYLIIITHIDDIVAKTSKKGICSVPLAARKLLLEGLLMVLGIDGEVVVSVDIDGTVTKTIKLFKPDIFARGGDRILGDIPDDEVAACEEIDCKIVYGVGDLLNSSSKIIQGEE